MMKTLLIPKTYLNMLVVTVEFMIQVALSNVMFAKNGFVMVEVTLLVVMS